MVFETSEAVSFAERVAPNSETELAYEVSGDATVEQLLIRFYPGQQLDLIVDIYIREKGGERKRPVVNTPGDSSFVGDDDTYEFNLSKPVSEGEELVVVAENTDPQYAYDVRVNAEVDYRGGSVGALYSKLKGVFN